MNVYFLHWDAPYRLAARLGIRTEWCLWKLLSWVDRSPVNCCAVGDGKRVVVSGLKGCHEWCVGEYEDAHPNVLAVACLPGDRIIEARSCVSAAVRSIRASGTAIPRRLWTPARLLAYLRDTGHVVAERPPGHPGSAVGDAAHGDGGSVPTAHASGRDHAQRAGTVYRCRERREVQPCPAPDPAGLRSDR